jgi:flagellar basal body-associated protein FliL
MPKYISCSKCNYFPVEEHHSCPKCGHNQSLWMILVAIVLFIGLFIGSILLIVNGWKKMNESKVQGVSRIILGTILGWGLFAFSLSDDNTIFNNSALVSDNKDVEKNEPVTQKSALNKRSTSIKEEKTEPAFHAINSDNNFDSSSSPITQTETEAVIPQKKSKSKPLFISIGALAIIGAVCFLVFHTMQVREQEEKEKAQQETTALALIASQQAQHISDSIASYNAAVLARQTAIQDSITAVNKMAIADSLIYSGKIGKLNITAIIKFDHVENETTHPLTGYYYYTDPEKKIYFKGGWQNNGIISFSTEENSGTENFEGEFINDMLGNFKGTWKKNNKQFDFYLNLNK